MPQYAHEVTPQETHKIEVESARHRPQWTPRARTEWDARRTDRMARSRVLVRGRYNARGSIVWDVLKIQGPRVSLYAKGLLWREEALEVGAQCMAGRFFVSVAGARAALVRGRGGLLIPDRHTNPLRQGVQADPIDGKAFPESMAIELGRSL